MVYSMYGPHLAKTGDSFFKINFHPIKQLSKQPLLKLSTVINMVWNLTNHVGNGYLNIITEYLCISCFSPLILMTSTSIIYSKKDPSEISWRKMLVARNIAIIYPFEFHPIFHVYKFEMRNDRATSSNFKIKSTWKSNEGTL